MLDREKILDADDLTVEIVDVPEWGGSVRVRSLTGKERDAFEQSITDLKGRDVRINTDNIRAKLVILSVVDDDGKRLFKNGDEAKVGEKSAAALQRIFNVANRLSGFSDRDVEELAGN